MIIDVTHVILGDVRPGGRAGGKIAQLSIREWLEENVGPYHGEDSREGPLDNWCVSVGSGWEFGTHATTDSPDSIMTVSWFVDIADEKLATMFTLRFV